MYATLLAHAYDAHCSVADRMKIAPFPLLFALFSISPTILGQECECETQCNQCNAAGSNTADCQTVCDIAADPTTCVEQCDATLHIGDTGASETGGSTVCECVTECNQCKADGASTADCQTVCEIAANATTCVEVCDETLHIGDTEATNPTSEGYALKIGILAIVGTILAVVVA